MKRVDEGEKEEKLESCRCKYKNRRRYTDTQIGTVIIALPEIPTGNTRGTPGGLDIAEEGGDPSAMVLIVRSPNVMISVVVCPSNRPHSSKYM